MSRGNRAALAIAIGISPLLSGCAAAKHDQPMCGYASPMRLMAESVPSASLVPCIRSLPEGWAFVSFTADEHQATFGLEREIEGGGTAHVTLRRSCDTTGLHQAMSDHRGVDEYAMPFPDGPHVTWVFEFEGGCVREHVVLPTKPTSAQSVDAIHDAVSFVARASLDPASAVS